VASEGHADGQPAAAQDGIRGTTAKPPVGDRGCLQKAVRTYRGYWPGCGLAEGRREEHAASEGTYSRTWLAPPSFRPGTRTAVVRLKRT
jgi:hypothetical protein